MKRNIHFSIIKKKRYHKLDFSLENLFCGGFTGRSEEAVKQHIEEMAKVGVPRPSAIPSLYRLSPSLITCSKNIEVVGELTSGEVEAVLLIDSEEMYITVGSDHTDRELEKISFQKSKQICSKIIAKEIWKFDDIKDHYDHLLLRSKVMENGREHTYQEGSVRLVRNPLDLVRTYKISNCGTIFFSGTIPTKKGRLIYSDYYKLEIIDPILNRKIEHEYSVNSL
jgi:hypothetical protein